jgi:type I restriction-modification system DNA methylase subunit
MDSLFTDDEVGFKEAMDVKKVASILGVSVATIKNWVRHEYLIPSTSSGKLLFDPSQVDDLKIRLSTGLLDRLNRRANKCESSVKFIPTEYAACPEGYAAIQFLIDLYNRESLDLETYLLAVVLNLLEKRNLITNGISKHYPSIQVIHTAFAVELEWWFKQAKEISFPIYDQLITCELPTTNDLLGVLYQSLVTEGAKSHGGSYFTPKTVVDAALEEHLKEHFMFLDPCCGTGQFLLGAAEIISNPLNIWGFEVDEIAAHIARLNIMLRFPTVAFSPHIYSINALFDIPSLAMEKDLIIPEFDAVFTNPPWGLHFTGLELSKVQVLFPTIKSNEAFSMFIIQGLQLLKGGGLLSYILPESILNIKVHSDIRKAILKSTRIRSVHHLGRIFQNVFTSAIRIDAQKDEATPDDKFIAVLSEKVREIQQSRFHNNPDYIFDIFTGVDDLAIFDKAYSGQYLTLQGNAEWALGVVTGNNTKYLSDTQNIDYEPILTGKDLRRFTAEPAKKFIKFTPKSFQQVAPVCKYRSAEKLIYKFISNELVFAYDSSQTLTLNSANIMIPFLPGYSVKTVLGFLNSSIYQVLFQKRFNAFKILRGDIEKLPFPIISSSNNRDIVEFVDMILNTYIPGEQKRNIFFKMDNYIMDIFGLDEKQKDYIWSSAKMSAKLLPFI